MAGLRKARDVQLPCMGENHYSVKLEAQYSAKTGKGKFGQELNAYKAPISTKNYFKSAACTECLLLISVRVSCGSILNKALREGRGALTYERTYTVNVPGWSGEVCIHIP